MDDRAFLKKLYGLVNAQVGCEFQAANASSAQESARLRARAQAVGTALSMWNQHYAELLKGDVAREVSRPLDASRHVTEAEAVFSSRDDVLREADAAVESCRVMVEPPLEPTGEAIAQLDAWRTRIVARRWPTQVIEAKPKGVKSEWWKQLIEEIRSDVTDLWAGTTRAHAPDRPVFEGLPPWQQVVVPLTALQRSESVRKGISAAEHGWFLPDIPRRFPHTRGTGRPIELTEDALWVVHALGIAEGWARHAQLHGPTSPVGRLLDGIADDFRLYADLCERRMVAPDATRRALDWVTKREMELKPETVKALMDSMAESAADVSGPLRLSRAAAAMQGSDDRRPHTYAFLRRHSDVFLSPDEHVRLAKSVATTRNSVAHAMVTRAVQTVSGTSPSGVAKPVDAGLEALHSVLWVTARESVQVYADLVAPHAVALATHGWLGGAAESMYGQVEVSRDRARTRENRENREKRRIGGRPPSHGPGRTDALRAVGRSCARVPGL